TRVSLLLFFFVPGLLRTAYGQTTSLYSYQDLSHLYYQSVKDSLKKAWTCPDVFKEHDTQKKFREFWDNRTESITDAIAHDDYVHDKEVYAYIAGIVRQITTANPQLVPFADLVLLDRSASVNAYTVGGHVLAVNLGLIVFSRTREELALAIAHEMSHDILNHFQNGMQERAVWLTSDDYKKSLNDVLHSKYDRLTRLHQILESYTFSRSRHQRYHESEADSLAVILLKKSNISFDARYFLHLDSADDDYLQRLQQPLRTYFAAYQLPYEDAWATRRSHGLSTRSYNFSDSSTIEDSVKTHPDCPQRYEQTRRWTSANPQSTPIPPAIREKANKMLIWDLYSSGTLTPCLYRILLAKDRGAKDPWYDFMVSNIFYGLYYADRQLNRFNAIGIIPKEYISRDYYALQTLFEQMPRESLRQSCETFGKEAFWTSLPGAERNLKDLLSLLALDPDESNEKQIAKAAHAFTTDNATSMYCEFADNFQKK
ncbi:MAG TPA: M48 family metalloprotease, partial [Puia sp.]|nr:M48 family metalloprotease [Puia sp.]